jgi:hypothetical protein
MWVFSLMALLFSVFAVAQDFPRPKKPSVSVAPIAPVTIVRGKPAKVNLAFRISGGYHINSNQPTGELLIPTTLKFDPPTDIVVGKVAYPPGEDYTFDFAPGEKLNVYSGDFRVNALVSAANSTPPGTYRVRGTLKYQACDNRACYPPAQVPLQFDVTVKKGASSSRTRRNPGQSPHVHR